MQNTPFGGLLKETPCERDREITRMVRDAFEELYETISVLREDAKDLDYVLGYALRGYEDRRFSERTVSHP